jgi:hypothetical protein
LRGQEQTRTQQSDNLTCLSWSRISYVSHAKSPLVALYTTRFHIQKMRRSEYLLVLSRISEQTAIISLYSTNWLVLVTQTESVYCAVRNEYSNKIQEQFLFKGRAMTQAVYRRSLTAEARIRFHAYPCEICGGQSGTETGYFFLSVLHFSSVSIIPPVLHTHLHLQADINRRKNGRSLRNFKKLIFRNARIIE